MLISSADVGMTANGAAGWGFIGEISSQRLRPYTAGFGAACTCAVGVAMSQLTPYMVNVNQWDWGLKTGWFYAGVGFPFALGVWLLIPETARYVCTPESAPCLLHVSLLIPSL